MFVPYKETVDGFEEHFQVNYLAHLTLTCLLLPKLKQSALDYQYSRVVNVSSATHRVAKYEDIKPKYVPFLFVKMYLCPIPVCKDIFICPIPVCKEIFLYPIPVCKEIFICSIPVCKHIFMSHSCL